MRTWEPAPLLRIQFAELHCLMAAVDLTLPLAVSDQDMQFMYQENLHFKCPLPGAPSLQPLNALDTRSDTSSTRSGHTPPPGYLPAAVPPIRINTTSAVGVTEIPISPLVMNNTPPSSLRSPTPRKGSVATHDRYASQGDTHKGLDDGLFQDLFPGFSETAFITEGDVIKIAAKELSTPTRSSISSLRALFSNTADAVQKTLGAQWLPRNYPPTADVSARGPVAAVLSLNVNSELLALKDNRSVRAPLIASGKEQVPEAILSGGVRVDRVSSNASASDRESRVRRFNASDPEDVSLTDFSGRLSYFASLQQLEQPRLNNYLHLP